MKIPEQKGLWGKRFATRCAGAGAFAHVVK